jgi:membrane protease YdiL (CAAX protease family)
MNEENVAVKDTNPSVKKKKRMNPNLYSALTLVLAYVMMILGQLLGYFMLPVKFYMNLDAKWIFIFELYFSFIGIHVVFLLYTLAFNRDVFKSFLPGKDNGNTLKMFAWGTVAGFRMNTACVIIALIHGDIHLSVGRFEIGYMLVSFLFVLIQSAAEEVVTRGFIFQRIKSRTNPWFAAFANAALFAALHLGNPGVSKIAIFNIFMFGFALSVVMVFTNSIWYCFAVHTAWNWCQNIFFGLPNSGLVSQGSFMHLDAARASIFYDPHFGVEATVSTTLVLLGLIRFFAYKYARKPSMATAGMTYSEPSAAELVNTETGIAGSEASDETIEQIEDMATSDELSAKTSDTTGV